MVEKKESEPKTNKEIVELTQVVTGTAPAFKLPDGEVVGMEDYLVWIGNLVWNIKKNTS